MTDRDELPPPERGQHDELILADVPGKGRAFQLKDKGMLEKYRAKGLLGQGRAENDRHYTAGEKYRVIARAGMQRTPQSVMGNLHRMPGGQFANPEDDRIDAEEQLRVVHNAIGPMATDCLLSVVHFDQSCHDWIAGVYRQRGWASPRRSVGIGHLREALWLLAKHWGLK